jgi:hypothetical protein
VILEDYCHAVEHSIEFQCVFPARAGRNAGFCRFYAGRLLRAFTPVDHRSRTTTCADFSMLSEASALKRDQLFWVLA